MKKFIILLNFCLFGLLISCNLCPCDENSSKKQVLEKQDLKNEDLKRLTSKRETLKTEQMDSTDDSNTIKIIAKRELRHKRDDNRGTDTIIMVKYENNGNIKISEYLKIENKVRDLLLINKKDEIRSFKETMTKGSGVDFIANDLLKEDNILDQDPNKPTKIRKTNDRKIFICNVYGDKQNTEQGYLQFNMPYIFMKNISKETGYSYNIKLDELLKTSYYFE